MLTTEAAQRHTIKGAGVAVAACLFTACAFQSGLCGKDPTGKLTYYIASIREKKIQGNWGERTQWVQRQETADGRWALETVGLGDTLEGMADAKMLDSAGSVVWEGRVYDVTLLAPSAPAFATTSSEGGGLEIYNLAVGPRPAFAAPELSVGEIQLSRDGSVFVVPVEESVWIISLSGKVLYEVSPPDSLRGVSIAVADSGRYIAFGGADPWLPPARPVPSSTADTLRLLEKLRRLGTPVTPAEVWHGNSTGPDDSLAGAERHRFAMPGANPRVIVKERTGGTAGEVRWGRGLPYAIALSEEDPPRVAVATGDRVSLWTCAGQRLWEDSATFAGSGWVYLAALYVSPDLQVLAAAGHSQDDAALYLWNRNGELEARVSLPKSVDLLRRWTPWPAQDDASVVFKIDTQTMTIRLAGEAR